MNKDDMIHEFRGPYRWLSNFWPVEIRREGRVYSSVEHAYMAAKADDQNWKDYCASNVTAGTIKRASRNIKLVPDWETHKLAVMLDCTRQKYADPTLANCLLATGDKYIQEGNTWRDRFWGVDLNLNPPIGLNHLGRIIMQVRTELREASQ